MENVRINRNSAHVPISVKIGYGLGFDTLQPVFHLFSVFFNRCCQS